MNLLLAYTHSRRVTLSKKMTRTIAVIGLIGILSIMLVFCTNRFTHKVNAQDQDVLHKYYTSIIVQPGDTLWSIADQYYELGYDSHNAYIKEVLQINHLSNADELICGTSIVIPYYSEEIK